MFIRKIVSGAILAGLATTLGCHWGNGTFLNRNKDANAAMSDSLGTGEFIVQQGQPVIEESSPVIIQQAPILPPPGVSTQTEPPKLNGKDGLPLTPAPMPKIVPQAQPTPANPVSRGK
ncbi:MAG: hypothetical protein EXR99_04485 [Gemmataceae bacterium]|nr:hypothetical protein [Gemmataceae bacterium]